MPSYVYHCRPCHFKRDVSHSIHEDPAVYCLECGDAMSRVPQAAGVVLKGKGFHKTDNRKDGTDE